jgi:hypothetical protein
LRQLIAASKRTTKKTAVPSIVAFESIATQRPSSVDFVGPQRARHNILNVLNINIFNIKMLYSETSIHRFRWGSEKETMDPGKQ